MLLPIAATLNHNVCLVLQYSRSRMLHLDVLDEIILLWLRDFSKYSQVLAKIQSAVSDANEAPTDEVILSVMISSFYEASVADKASYVSTRNVNNWASKSFSHHDGAMAMLKLRRQLDRRTSFSWITAWF